MALVTLATVQKIQNQNQKRATRVTLCQRGISRRSESVSVSVCLSLCHKSVLCGNGWTNRAVC